MTALVGPDKARELWPLAKGQLQEPERGKVFAQLARCSESAPEGSLEWLWDRVDPADELLEGHIAAVAKHAQSGQNFRELWTAVDHSDSSLKLRLDLGANFSQKLRLTQGESYQALAKVTRFDVAEQAVAGLQSLELPTIEGLPVVLRGSVDLGIEQFAGQEISLRVKAFPSGDDAWGLWENNRRTETILTSSEDHPEWREVDLAPSKGGDYRINSFQWITNPDTLTITDFEIVPKFLWRGLFECLKKPEGPEQLERIHQVVESWPEAIKHWSLLDETISESSRAKNGEEPRQ